MRRQFLITDKAGTDFGILTYAADTRVWHIEINPERTWDDTPLSLALHIKQGIYSLNERQSLEWVRDRIVPPNRQNINQLLGALGITEYDELVLIQHTKGVSTNDNLFLVELDR